MGAQECSKGGQGSAPLKPGPQSKSTTLQQYLKSRLNDSRANVPGVPFPDFKIRRECDKTSMETSEMSWSVMKQISSAIKRRMTVNCLTQDVPAPADETKLGTAEAMSLDEEVRNYIAAETGKERLKRAWNTKKYMDVETPRDLDDAMRVGFNCSLFGFLYGLIKHGKEESDAFLVRNRTTLYGSRSLANKRLANSVIGYGLRKGIGFAIFGFIGSFSITGLYKVISIYHNTSAPWTMALSTGTVLSVWKSSLGIKGAVGGFIIGNVFGCVFGLPFWLLLKGGGVDQERANYKTVEAMVQMKRYYRSSAGPAINEDEDEEDEKVD